MIFIKKFLFQGIEQWHVRKSYTEFDFQIFDFLSIATVSVLNQYLQRQKEVRMDMLHYNEKKEKKRKVKEMIMAVI